ncbi:hypothetical protein B566_EDAN009396 [Ephemera danica]|nr:hypothetical protein B566_EDAN009396 [Ephemera danica]
MGLFLVSVEDSIENELIKDHILTNIGRFCIMLKYLVFAAIWTISGTSKVPYVEHKFIREIKEGPYQNYSGQPLVDLGGKFYYFEMNVASTWSEASSFCRNLGLFLVSVEDSVENELIKDYIRANTGPYQNYSGPRDFWTSGSDSAHEGQFVWTSTGRPVTFTYWHPYQPDNGAGKEEIIVYWYNSGVLKWNDYQPTANIYAICEEEV